MKKLLVIMMMIFCAGYTQAQKQKLKATVSSFSVETNSLEELKNYDWRSLKHFFKDNEKNDSIQIKICIKNDDSKGSNKEFKLNNSSTTIKGQTYELNKMIRTVKRLTKEIIKINKEFKE